MVTTANTPRLRRALLGSETAPLRARTPRQNVRDDAGKATAHPRLDRLRQVIGKALDD